jgi:predicted MPP superfamily phosphohydrolase
VFPDISIRINILRVLSLIVHENLHLIVQLADIHCLNDRACQNGEIAIVSWIGRRRN